MYCRKFNKSIEQGAPAPLKPFAFVVRMAEVLARPSATPDFGFGDFFRGERADVAMQLHFRPVLAKHALAIRVHFALKHNFDPGALKAKIESTDSSEERGRAQIGAT